jgi:hypothetical protein
MSEEQVVEEVVAEEVVAQRIITMDNGKAVDFGKRANVLVDIDQEGIITFSLANGKSVVWKVSDLDNLTPFQVQVFLYGLASKVKSSLAPIKELDAIEAVINKQIESINNGTFYLKVGKEAVAKLTNLQKAYAIVKASTDVDFADWTDLTKVEVIEDVVARWEAFTTSEKNSIRKNAYVKLELAKLDIAAVKDEEELI